MTKVYQYIQDPDTYQTDKILWSSSYSTASIYYRKHFAKSITNNLSPHYPSMSTLTNTKHKGPNNDTCASKNSKEKVKRVNDN